MWGHLATLHERHADASGKYASSTAVYDDAHAHHGDAVKRGQSAFGTTPDAASTPDAATFPDADASPASNATAALSSTGITSSTDARQRAC